MSATIVEPSLSISDFCKAENVTRPTYYLWKRLGIGPREMRIGRIVRITHRARLDWQKAREKSTEGQREADEKQHARALVAGAAAMASPKHISKRKSA